jgi:hypothetical protein
MFLGLGLLATSSCETTNLDLTDNPNSLTTAANADLLLNNVQVDNGNTNIWNNIC